MMAGVRAGGRLSARAKNHAGCRLREEGPAPRFAPLPVLFHSTYFDVHFRQISFLTEKSCLEPALLRN